MRCARRSLGGVREPFLGAGTGSVGAGGASGAVCGRRSPAEAFVALSLVRGSTAGVGDSGIGCEVPFFLEAYLRFYRIGELVLGRLTQRDELTRYFRGVEDVLTDGSELG